MVDHKSVNLQVGWLATSVRLCTWICVQREYMITVESLAPKVR